MATPEERARQRIDIQLIAAGWKLQNRDEMNLGAGLGVAVREYPLATGPADYLLFVDRRACGIIEAKPEGTTLSGVADQAVKYQHQLPAQLANAWGDPLRFDYEASGSEILFSDRNDPDQRSRYIFAFQRPETLLTWLKAQTTLRARLRAMPALNTTGLRDCQTEAITNLEASMAQGRPRALIQMTMGAGKTFTAATAAYRLLAHADARRVLFLVDRNNLGRQTLKEFQAYRPPGTGHLFTELYNVQRLGAAGLDPDAKVVISTIQRVYAQLTGAQLDEDDEEISAFETETTGTPEEVAYNDRMPPETFDIVIIDECHRSIYGRWRQVLDYFDAFQIGLTATPSSHTLGYFQRNLVSEYTLERSVIDKVNVPHEVYRIRTQIGEHGSTLPSGFTVPRRDRHTRRQRYEQLTEDFVYTPPELDRSVVATNQIRTVLNAYREALATELFPGRTEVPKTLIFAKDDHHAEEIVHIVRDVFAKGNDFAKKITYKVSGVSPEELISEFRNQYNPRIAVTVDMIATGTDIKPVEVLIFMRDVRSQLYFEQMLGRGVRTITAADLTNVTPDARAKDRFIVVDAVGVTESCKQVSAPLETQRTVAFDRLLEHAASGQDNPDLVSTLAVRLAMLDRKLTASDQDQIVTTSGGLTLTDIAARLLSSLDNDRIETEAQAEHPAPVTDAQFEATARRLRNEALRTLSDNPALRRLLIDLKKQSELVIDDLSIDHVLSGAFDERAAGEMTRRFEDFLVENQDEIAALAILYNKPYARRRLTYENLEDLRRALARPPWLLEPLAVWGAYKRLSRGMIKSDPGRVLTDVVALVRYALHPEDGLAPLAATTAARFNLWLGREEKAGRTYSPRQRIWLEAVRDHLAANIDMSLKDLQDQPTFSGLGGVVAAKAEFGDRLQPLLDDLTDALVA